MDNPFSIENSGTPVIVASRTTPSGRRSWTVDISGEGKVRVGSDDHGNQYCQVHGPNDCQHKQAVAAVK